MSLLKQNAARNRVFDFTGLSLTSLTVEISKDGGSFAAPAGTLSNITGNFFNLALDAADTNVLGDLAYKWSDSILGIVTPDNESSDQVVALLPGDDVVLDADQNGVTFNGNLIVDGNLQISSGNIVVDNSVNIGQALNIRSVSVSEGMVIHSGGSNPDGLIIICNTGPSNAAIRLQGQAGSFSKILEGPIEGPRGTT